MRAFKSLTVMAAGAALLVGTVAAVSAQSDWQAPAEAKKLKNPEKGTDLGKKAVETNCASCHGPKGEGNGPAAAAMNPKPANWLSDNVKKETDGEIFWKISNGRPEKGMPAWKSMIPDKDRWQIVNYIRQLQKSGGK